MTEITDRIRYGYTILFIVLSVIGTLVTYYLLGSSYALLSLYAPIGTIVAFILVLDQSFERFQLFQIQIQNKLIMVIVLISVSTVLLTDTYMIDFIIFAIIGYMALDTIIHNKNPKFTLFLILISFIIYMLKNTLYRGYFFGGGDIFIHLDYIQRLLTENSIEGLQGTRYYFFPNLHVLTAIISDVLNILPYSSIRILGASSFAGGLIIFTVMITKISSRKYALLGTLLLSSSPLYLYYAAYSYPQSIATIYFLFVFAGTISVIGGLKRTSFTSIFISIPLAFTHHFTYFLFLIISIIYTTIHYILILLINIVSPIQYADEQLPMENRKSLLFLVAIFFPLSYWTFVNPDFILSAGMAFLDAIYQSYESFYTDGSGKTAQTSAGLGINTFGEVDLISTERSFRWLLSPFGIYPALILSLFVVGLQYISNEDNSHFNTIFVVGILSSLIIFKLPIGFKSIIRLRGFFIIFFIIVPAGGAYLLIEGSDHISTRSVVILLLVVSMGHFAGPVDYYDQNSRVTNEKILSIEESNQIIQTGKFAEKYSESITVYHTSRIILNYFSTDLQLKQISYTNKTINISPGLMLNRQNWIGHSIPFIPKGTYGVTGNGVFVVSQNWYQQSMTSQNVVYSSGDIQLTWSNQTRDFNSKP